MKVQTSAPWQFRTTAQVDPNKVNENMSYVAKLYEDVLGKRYGLSQITLPLYANASSGYKDGYTQEELTYRLVAPDTMWIEGIYLDGATVSGDCRVFLIDTATGLPPSDVADVDGYVVSATTTEATTVYANQILMNAGATYAFILTKNTTANFTTQKLDLTIHLKTDRFNTSGTDQYVALGYNGLFLNEATSTDATTFLTPSNSVSSTVSASNAQQRSLKCMAFVAHTFTTSTSANVLKWTIPSTDSNKGRSKIVRIDCYAVFDSNGAATHDRVQWQLKDKNTIVQLTAQIEMTGVKFGSTSQVVSIDMSQSSSGVESNTGQDCTLSLSRVDASTAVCAKSYCYLWVE